MRNQKSVPKKDANFLPLHICKSFETELTTLISSLPDDSFRNRYQKDEFLSKYCDTTESAADERRAAAIKKWLQVEARNEVSNARISLGDEDFGWTTSDQIIDHTRRLISQVLGTLEYCYIFPDASHSNGASTRISRGPKAQLLKHGGKAHVSSSCLKYWYSFASNSKLADQELEIQESSVMFTVPKNADIDRVACKEPEINMFLQRRVGAYIKRRLLKFGINLRDQGINRKLAQEALARDLATIDLSSASDTITNSLVMAVLPTEWWSFLDDLRVHYADIDGEIHRLSMFSSMGNGFTFELESLIFWALTRSVARLSKKKGRISVFGDDIIAPTSIAPRIARVFSWFGFTVNLKKSAWSGKFRESCGGHYFDGEDITPFYLREPIASKTHVIHMLNRLLLWDSYGYLTFISQDASDFHEKWRHVIPRTLWGGQDPEDTTSLVTGDLPSQRLVPVQDRLPVTGELGLLFWFTRSTMERTEYMTKALLNGHRRGTGGMAQCLTLSRIFGRKESFPFEGVSIVPTLDRKKYSMKEYEVFCRSELSTWNPYLVKG